MRGIRKNNRPAFTLVELLVVMSIILTLAVLGYILLPGLFNNYGRVRAVDAVTQRLLIAKQRAKRDGLPTGVRLLLTDENGSPVPLNDDDTVSVRRLQYVQQPEPLVGGTRNAGGWAGGYISGVTNNPTSTILTFSNVDFLGGAATASEQLVQPGDVLELFGGGAVYAIAGVTANTLVVNDPTVVVPNQTGSYRILRQPRPLQGENVFTIPSEVVIDLGKPTLTGGVPISFKSDPNAPSKNVPERLVAGAPPLFVEVLFSPTGGVVGSGSTTGKVLLWLRDTRVSPPRLDTQTILGINVRTGYIGAHDPAPGSNPYVNTEDGRSSGL